MVLSFKLSNYLLNSIRLFIFSCILSHFTFYSGMYSTFDFSYLSRALTSLSTFFKWHMYRSQGTVSLKNHEDCMGKLLHFWCFSLKQHHQKSSYSVLSVLSAISMFVEHINEQQYTSSCKHHLQATHNSLKSWIFSSADDFWFMVMLISSPILI